MCFYRVFQKEKAIYETENYPIPKVARVTLKEELPRVYDLIINWNVIITVQNG